MKNEKKSNSDFSRLGLPSPKWLIAPALFAVTLRYAPYAVYGNSRVYEKEVPISVIDNFLSEENVQELRDWIKDERRFATAIEAATQGVVSVGEEESILPDGTCESTEFTSANNDFCHVAGRSDIFKHYAATGGWYGAKETLKKLFSSIYTFINYYPDRVKDPVIQKLFKSDTYQKEVKKICAAGLGFENPSEWSARHEDIHFHPLQVNIVMIPPGMDLPLHQDNQWFWGTNQRSAPDWLLHVMKESGRFDDIMIPQAQGVSYLHGTADDPIYKNGGRYLYYPNGPGAPVKSIPPKRGQAIIMDGGRTIHGVERTHPGHVSGHLRRGGFNRIEYQGNETWYILSDDDLVDVYQTEDFRMTFVWRGLCFENAEQEAKFEAELESKDFTDNEEILKVLDDDLHKKGKLPKEKTLENMKRKDFIRLLQKVYMQYPLDVPGAWFPMNYCALGYQKPWLTWLLSPFCQDIRPRKPLNDQYPPAKPFCDPLGRVNRNTNCPMS